MKSLITKISLSLMLLLLGNGIRAQDVQNLVANVSTEMANYPNYGLATYMDIDFVNASNYDVPAGNIRINIALPSNTTLNTTVTPPVAGWNYVYVDSKNAYYTNTITIPTFSSGLPAGYAAFHVPFYLDGPILITPAQSVLVQITMPISALPMYISGQAPKSTAQITVGSTPLGVQFSAFNVVSKGCSNEIYWSTATEIGNNHFDVERSIDGRVFASINKVPSKGSKNATQDYSFVDANPINGANYYRVRQTDNDGVTSVTVVRKVETDCSKAVISIFPNPTLSVLNVNGLEKGQIIEIYNTLGQSILKTTVKNETEVVDMAEFVNGTYNFRVFSNGVAIFTTKVVKN